MSTRSIATLCSKVHHKSLRFFDQMEVTFQVHKFLLTVTGVGASLGFGLHGLSDFLRLFVRDHFRLGPIKYLKSKSNWLHSPEGVQWHSTRAQWDFWEAKTQQNYPRVNTTTIGNSPSIMASITDSLASLSSRETNT